MLTANSVDHAAVELVMVAWKLKKASIPQNLENLKDTTEYIHANQECIKNNISQQNQSKKLNNANMSASGTHSSGTKTKKEGQPQHRSSVSRVKLTHPGRNVSIKVGHVKIRTLQSRLAFIL